MGGGELGAWVEPGGRNTPDPDEYVRLRGDQLAPRNGRYELRITDVLENADAAEAANIVATPAVVRRAPLPVRIVVGDLSDRNALAHGLGVEADGDDLEGNDR